MKFEFSHACCHSYFYTYLRYNVSVYQCIQAVYQTVFQLSRVEKFFFSSVLYCHQPRFRTRPPVHLLICISRYKLCIWLVYSFSIYATVISSNFPSSGEPESISSSAFLLFFRPVHLLRGVYDSKKIFWAFMARWGGAVTRNKVHEDSRRVSHAIKHTKRLALIAIN